MIVWLKIGIFTLLAGLTIPLTAAERDPAQDAFFDALTDLCGARFEGVSTFPEDPGDAWRDQRLVAVISTCTTGEVRIPLQVGEDRSRTWVLRRVPGGLQLKHDHRHEDGTPDEVTEYGGTTREVGTPRSQTFPADAYTAELIPEAATNAWSITFDDSGQVLTYYLERHGKPRFEAVLRRVQ